MSGGDASGDGSGDGGPSGDAAGVGVGDASGIGDAAATDAAFADAVAEGDAAFGSPSSVFGGENDASSVSLSEAVNTGLGVISALAGIMSGNPIGIASGINGIVGIANNAGVFGGISSAISGGISGGVSGGVSGGSPSAGDSVGASGLYLTQAGAAAFAGGANPFNARDRLILNGPWQDSYKAQYLEQRFGAYFTDNAPKKAAPKPKPVKAPAPAPVSSAPVGQNTIYKGSTSAGGGGVAAPAPASSIWPVVIAVAAAVALGA